MRLAKWSLTHLKGMENTLTTFYKDMNFSNCINSSAYFFKNYLYINIKNFQISTTK